MAKVMLVEDDNNLREIYEARLAAEGYEIVAAQDGEEALALAVKERPDLIIADVMMPKVSGFDMLDILRSTPETKHSKIIMMTALSQAEDKTRAEKLGADRYLVKSQVTLEDVVKVAGEILSDSGAPPAAAAATPAVAPTSEPTPTATPAPVAAEPTTPPSVALPTPVDPTTSTPDATPTAAPASTATVADSPMPVATPPSDPTSAAATPSPTPTPTDDSDTPEASTAAAEEVAENSVSTATQEATASKQIEEFIAGNPTLTTSAEPPKDTQETTAAADAPTTAPEAPAAPVATETPPADASTPAGEPASPTPEPAPATAEPTGLVEEVITTPAPGAGVSPPPASTPSKTTIPVTVADEEPTSPPATAASGTDADKTMAKAVEGLLGSSGTESPASAATPAPASPENAETTAEADTENDKPQLAKKRGGERVITPLSDPRTSGPDLNALLAKEEANAGAAPLSVNTVISPDGSVNSNPDAPAIKTESFDATPGSVVQAPPANGETTSSDPNNIAL